MNDPLVLSQTDGRPMYLQIVDQIQQRVAIGDWPPGFQLPSIRELAIATRVSVITVKRAYQELESGGVIVTRQGKGSFVAEIDNLGLQLRQQELTEQLRQAAATAKKMGIQRDDLLEQLGKLLDGDTQ